MEKPKIAAFLAAGLVAVLVGGRLLRGCGETEEDRVRAALAALVKAVEARDLARSLEWISGEYRDGEGNTRDVLRSLLFMYFRQHDKISVRTEGDVAVKIRKDGIATAVFYARLAEGAIDGLAGGGESWRFEVELRKEGGDWHVVTHRREPAARP